MRAINATCIGQSPCWIQAYQLAASSGVQANNDYFLWLLILTIILAVTLAILIPLLIFYLLHVRKAKDKEYQQPVYHHPIFVASASPPLLGSSAPTGKEPVVVAATQPPIDRDSKRARGELVLGDMRVSRPNLAAVIGGSISEHDDDSVRVVPAPSTEIQELEPLNPLETPGEADLQIRAVAPEKMESVDTEEAPEMVLEPEDATSDMSVEVSKELLPSGTPRATAPDPFALMSPRAALEMSGSLRPSRPRITELQPSGQVLTPLSVSASRIETVGAAGAAGSKSPQVIELHPVGTVMTELSSKPSQVLREESFMTPPPSISVNSGAGPDEEISYSKEDEEEDSTASRSFEDYHRTLEGLDLTYSAALLDEPEEVLPPKIVTPREEDDESLPEPPKFGSIRLEGLPEPPSASPNASPRALPEPPRFGSVRLDQLPEPPVSPRESLRELPEPPKFSSLRSEGLPEPPELSPRASVIEDMPEPPSFGSLRGESLPEPPVSPREDTALPEPPKFGSLRVDDKLPEPPQSPGSSLRGLPEPPITPRGDFDTSLPEPPPDNGSMRHGALPEPPKSARAPRGGAMVSEDDSLDRSQIEDSADAPDYRHADDDVKPPSGSSSLRNDTIGGRRPSSLRMAEPLVFPETLVRTSSFGSLRGSDDGIAGRKPGTLRDAGGPLQALEVQPTLHMSRTMPTEALGSLRGPDPLTLRNRGVTPLEGLDPLTLRNFPSEDEVEPESARIHKTSSGSLPSARGSEL